LADKRLPDSASLLGYPRCIGDVSNGTGLVHAESVRFIDTVHAAAGTCHAESV